MIQEQNALVEKANESLKAAELLYSDGFYEFVVSRTYYSMFYIAEAMLLGKNLSFSKHSAVIANFGKEFIKSGQVEEKYHKYLIEAQNIRNIGDYDCITKISEEEAKEQIERARDFLQIICAN